MLAIDLVFVSPMFEEFICTCFTCLKLAVHRDKYLFLDGLSSSELSESDSPVFLYRIVNLTVISFLFSSIQRSIPRSTFAQQKLSSSVTNIECFAGTFLAPISADPDSYSKPHLSWETALSSLRMA